MAARPATWNGFKPRKPIGAEKRARVQAEAGEARAFEDLLLQHRLDFWHCTVAQRSQPGWPDYVILGNGWLAFVELKARSPNTRRAGKVSPGQERYKASIEAAGAEWRTFLLPDEWPTVYAWLTAKTGREIYEVTA